MPAHPATPSLTLILLATLCTTTRADDGAASIAAGGIVMKHEPRITMQKEVLRIGARKVQVDYEFRNDTDTDITTEVAFPVPGYSIDTLGDSLSIPMLSFADFQLTVEGHPAHFDMETKATLHGRDVSGVLHRYGIDIATFGRLDESNSQPKDLRTLSAAQRAALIHAGLIVSGRYEYLPAWTVEKKYYWLQTFPAHAIIHISHEYTPVLGNSNTIGLGDTPKDDLAETKSVCVDPTLRNQLKRLAANRENEVSISYVDFILTTANTWKTPIEDFTLIVERPPFDLMQGDRKLKGQTFVSFCWDGPVTKIDADHFSAHLDNFIPKKEIRIGFITADDWFKSDR